MRAPPDFASKLRWWRRNRGISQLDLAGRAQISQRHLSFLELGRASPSREMVLRLAVALDVPLRQQNALLLAAGLAPVWHETELAAPELAPSAAASITCSPSRPLSPPSWSIAAGTCSKPMPGRCGWWSSWSGPWLPALR